MLKAYFLSVDLGLNRLMILAKIKVFRWEIALCRIIKMFGLKKIRAWFVGIGISFFFVVANLHILTI